MSFSHKFVCYVLICLLFVQSVSADTRETRIGGQHWIYELLESHEYLLVPIVGATVGGLNGGRNLNNVQGGQIIGAVVGFMLGAVDEVMIASGVFDGHHLTYALSGATILGALPSPYYISGVLGLGLGYIKSKGYFDDAVAHASGPMNAMVHGAAYNGVKGGVAGVVVGGVDEVLTSNEITSKPYLTDALTTFTQVCIVAKILATALKSIPKVGEIYQTSVVFIPVSVEHVAIVLVAYQLMSQQLEPSEGGDGSPKSMTPLAVVNRVKKSFNQVANPEEVDELVQRQELILMATQIVGLHFSQLFARNMQNFATQLIGLKTITPEGVSLYKKALVAFAFVVGEGVAYDSFAKVLSGYYNVLLSQSAQDAIKNEYFSGENPLRLSQDPEAEALVAAMDDNIQTLTIVGSELMTGAVGSYVGGICYVFFLHTNQALDFVVLLQTYSQLTKAVTIWLSSEDKRLMEEIEKLDSKIVALEKSITANARTVVLADKIDYLNAKRSLWLAEEREAKSDLNFNQLMVTVWSTSVGLFKAIVNYSFIVFKIEAGEIKFENYNTVVVSGMELSNSYSWYAQNANKLSRLEHAMESLGKLMEKMHNSIVDEKSALVYGNKISDRGGFSIEGVSIGVLNKTLLDNQTLDLPVAVYSFTGDSGSGKSTILTKLKRIEYSGSYGAGSILYHSLDGSDPKICVVTQEDYIPPHVTLLEIILAKALNGVENLPKLEAQVTALLKEIRIDGEGDESIISQLNTEKQWGATLSGGQKRKVAIVSAIMQQPDILFLDEAFNGLDEESIRNVQRMLRYYLANKMILVVDHHAHTNNFDEFYDTELHLEDQAIEFRTHSGLAQEEVAY